MTAEKQPDSRRQRTRAVLLICIVLLLCGIGAEGYLLIRRAEKAITVMQRDPAEELLAAVHSGDYEGARLIRMTDYPEGTVPAAVAEKLTEEAKIIRDAYFAGQTDADAAKALTIGLMQLGIPAVTEAVQPYSEAIRLREAQLMMIGKADAAFYARDYAEAVAQYRRLPQNDETLRAIYQDRFEESTLRLAAQTAAALCEAESSGDFDTAISLVQNISRLYDKKDAFWTKILEQVKDAKKYAGYLEACRQARICFDAGDYSAAFEALNSPQAVLEDLFRSDRIPGQNSAFSLLAETKACFQEAYFLLRSEQLGKLLEAFELEKAEEIVTEAETLFPDAPETTALCIQLTAAEPKELISLGEPELSDFTQTTDALTGSDGKVYQSDTGNLYCSFDGTLSGRKSCSAVFRPEGGFRRLTLTAVPLSSFDTDTVVLLEVSADNRELETYAVSRENGALHIDLNITGAKKLRLRVRPAGTDEDLRHAGVLIADAVVT